MVCILPGGIAKNKANIYPAIFTKQTWPIKDFDVITVHDPEYAR